MKCHYLYAAAILICAGAIGAEEIPVPEKLKQVLALLHKKSETEKAEDKKDETE